MKRSHAVTIFGTTLFFGTATFALLMASARAQPPDITGPYYPSISLEQAIEDIGGQTLVSVNVKNAPLDKVLEEISKQVGFTLKATTSDDTPALVTLTRDKQPFWSVLRDLSARAELRLDIFADKSNTRPVQIPIYSDGRNGLKGVPFVSGPFLLVANSLRQTVTKTVAFEENPGDKEVKADTKEEVRQAEVYFTLFSDPKFSTSASAAELKIETVVDENGRSLKPGSRTILTSYNSLNTIIQRLNSPISTPTNVGKRIARVQGTVSVYLPRKIEHWEISSPLKTQGESHTVLGNGMTRTYQIESVQDMGNRYEVLLKITGESPESLGAGGGNLGFNLITRTQLDRSRPRLQIVDAQNNSLFPLGAAFPMGVANTNYRVTFIKPNKKPNGETAFTEPVKLIIDIPYDFAELKLPFEFTNLPLPQ